MENYLIQPLFEFIRLFEDLGIPYALMGGVAVGVHGIPRPTHDLDFTISIDRSRLPGLYSVVEQRGYSVPEQYASGWVDAVAGMPLVRARQWVAGKAIDIDIFLAESRFQQSVIDRRKQLEVDDMRAWVVSPEDLIVLKIISGRPRDIADVLDILLTQGQLDEAYMRKWCDELGVLPLLEKTLADARTP